MRYRWLIEQGGPEDNGAVYLGQVDVEGEYVYGQPFRCDDVDAAKEMVERSEENADTLKWKEPPIEWQPDALCVSQYVDDGIEANF